MGNLVDGVTCEDTPVRTTVLQPPRRHRHLNPSLWFGPTPSDNYAIDESTIQRDGTCDFDAIADETLEHILSLVPSADLYECSLLSVCKRWYACLKNPRYSHKHRLWCNRWIMYTPSMLVDEEQAIVPQTMMDGVGPQAIWCVHDGIVYEVPNIRLTSLITIPVYKTPWTPGHIEAAVSRLEMTRYAKLQGIATYFASMTVATTTDDTPIIVYLVTTDFVVFLYDDGRTRLYRRTSNKDVCDFPRPYHHTVGRKHNLHPSLVDGYHDGTCYYALFSDGAIEVFSGPTHVKTITTLMDGVADDYSRDITSSIVVSVCNSPWSKHELVVFTHDMRVAYIVHKHKNIHRNYKPTHPTVRRPKSIVIKKIYANYKSDGFIWHYAPDKHSAFSVFVATSEFTNTLSHSFGKWDTTTTPLCMSGMAIDPVSGLTYTATRQGNALTALKQW
jgi:hypothetical protein